MTFRTGPVGGWNGCPDPRIVAGLTRGEGHGARLTMGGRQLIEFLHPQGLSLRTIAAQVGASASTVKRELIGCRARIRRREPTNRPSTLRRAPKG